MIMKLLNPVLALASTTFLGLLLPAAADEQGEESAAHLHRRTRSEIRDFLKERSPESLEALRHAEEEGHQEAIEKFWSDAAKLVGEFHHTREALGEVAAETYLKLRHMESVADRLTERYHHSKDQSEAEHIAQQLRAVIGAHLDGSLQLERIHLERARSELDEAAREVEETASHREDIINQEVKQRLFGEVETGEHDHRHGHGDHGEEKAPIPSDAEDERERVRTGEGQNKADSGAPREEDVEEEAAPEDEAPEKREEAE